MTNSPNSHTIPRNLLYQSVSPVQENTGVAVQDSCVLMGDSRPDSLVSSHVFWRADSGIIPKGLPFALLLSAWGVGRSKPAAVLRRRQWIIDR
jgi:hypothetical protein